MTPVDAVTHHHHVFLKAAYKHGDYIKLHNTDQTIKPGAKYIAFEPVRCGYAVYTRGRDRPRLTGRFDNIESAMFCVRRR
jgi:hypothetical protein